MFFFFENFFELSHLLNFYTLYPCNFATLYGKYSNPKSQFRQVLLDLEFSSGGRPRGFFGFGVFTASSRFTIIKIIINVVRCVSRNTLAHLFLRRVGEWETDAAITRVWSASATWQDHLLGLGLRERDGRWVLQARSRWQDEPPPSPLRFFMYNPCSLRVTGRLEDVALALACGCLCSAHEPGFVRRMRNGIVCFSPFLFSFWFVFFALHFLCVFLCIFLEFFEFLCFTFLWNFLLFYFLFIFFIVGFLSFSCSFIVWASMARQRSLWCGI